MRIPEEVRKTPEEFVKKPEEVKKTPEELVKTPEEVRKTPEEQVWKLEEALPGSLQVLKMKAIHWNST